MSEAQFDPIPETGDDLIVQWAKRDAEYAKRRVPLDDEAVIAIRQGRKREAEMLPSIKDRARMYARATAWVPPSHPEFGDMKELLNG